MRAEFWQNPGIDLSWLLALSLPLIPWKKTKNLLYTRRPESFKTTDIPSSFRWIPRHSGLIGNEKGDLAAKNRAAKGGRSTERWSSLAYIKRNVTEMRSKGIARWHKTETQDRESSRRGYHIPRTKEGISLILGSAPKKYTSRYYQLKKGQGAVGTFLARIGVIETHGCWWCGAAEQTAEHLYARCRKWRKKRRKLVRELGKEGIKWQPQVERRWLAGLLGDEKAVAPLLKFSKATGIGGRKGARERKLGWERKSDQEGEDLLA